MQSVKVSVIPLMPFSELQSRILEERLQKNRTTVRSFQRLVSAMNGKRANCKYQFQSTHEFKVYILVVNRGNPHKTQSQS